MDAAADGAGGVRVLVEAEECVVTDALDGAEDVGEGDAGEGTCDVGATLASACDGDESRAAQLRRMTTGCAPMLPARLSLVAGSSLP